MCFLWAKQASPRRPLSHSPILETYKLLRSLPKQAPGASSFPRWAPSTSERGVSNPPEVFPLGSWPGRCKMPSKLGEKEQKGKRKKEDTGREEYAVENGERISERFERKKKVLTKPLRQLWDKNLALPIEVERNKTNTNKAMPCSLEKIDCAPETQSSGVLSYDGLARERGTTYGVLHSNTFICIPYSCRPPVILIANGSPATSHNGGCFWFPSWT